MSHTCQRAARGRWPRGSGDWSSQVENPHRRGANPAQITQLQQDTREHFMPRFTLHTQKRPPSHQAPRPPPAFLPGIHRLLSQPGSSSSCFLGLWLEMVTRASRKLQERIFTILETREGRSRCQQGHTQFIKIWGRFPSG